MDYTQLQKELQLKINELSKLDLTAEKIVLHLLETFTSIDSSQLRLKYLGNFNRSNQKDIESVTVDKDTGDVLISLNRNGLYDQLPKGLFHALSRRRNLASIDMMLHDSERLKKEESSARQFFEPFEQSLFSFQLELAEKENNARISNLALKDLLTNDDRKNLDQKTKCLLIDLLPTIHNVQLLENKMGELLTLCLKENVSIEKIFKTSKVKHHQNMKLGCSPLGDFHYLDHQIELAQTIYLIKINNLKKVALKSFLPSGRNEVMLRHLCKYLLPATSEIEIIPVLSKEDAKCQFNPKLQPIMGITTVLN